MEEKLKNDDKQELILLLDLISKIIDQPKNKWFMDKLSSMVSSPTQSNNLESFIRMQKKNYRRKALSFYKSVKDETLKGQLVNDHMSMLWFQQTGHIAEFCKYVCLQFENLINYYCVDKDCYSKILHNPNIYITTLWENFNVDCQKCFFDKFQKPIPIEKVHIWQKIVFFCGTENKWEWRNTNNQNLSNMVNLRNATSHRSSTSPPKNIKTIKVLEKGDFSHFSYYINLLKEVLKHIGTRPTKSTKSSRNVATHQGLEDLKRMKLK